jgi:hypothetical protein
MSEASIRFLLALGFTAGGYIVAFKRMRKDVNGIGKRQRDFEENATKAIMASCPPADRIAIGQLLKGKSNG